MQLVGHKSLRSASQDLHVSSCIHFPMKTENVYFNPKLSLYQCHTEGVICRNMIMIFLLSELTGNVIRSCYIHVHIKLYSKAYSIFLQIC